MTATPINRARKAIFVPTTAANHCYGGFACVKSTIDQEHKNADNRGTGSLVPGARNVSRGSVNNTYLKTDRLFDTMQKLKPDAMVSAVKSECLLTYNILIVVGKRHR